MGHFTEVLDRQREINRLLAENERLRAALAEIVRMYDDDDDCGDLDAADLAEVARIAIAISETKSPARHEASGAN